MQIVLKRSLYAFKVNQDVVEGTPNYTIKLGTAMGNLLSARLGARIIKGALHNMIPNYCACSYLL